MELLSVFTLARAALEAAFTKNLPSVDTFPKGNLLLSNAIYSTTVKKSFLVLLFSTFTLLSHADPISRRNWILEQLSTPVGEFPLDSRQGNFRTSLSVTNYGDAFSGMLGLLSNLGPLELAAYGSQRVFASVTESGREFKDASEQDSASIAGELARAYMTREGHFGRGSAQYIYFPKNKTAFLRVGLNMGINETLDSPWVLRLNTHFYFPMQGNENRTYSSQVEVGQTIHQLSHTRWRLGFFFGWTYKTHDEIEDLLEGEAIRQEHMLFSIGPWLEYATHTYNLKLGLPWRVWLDKESYKKGLPEGGQEKIVHYPSHLHLPDIQANMSFYL